MATPVIMPKFGMAQEEGTIIRWLKGEGDPVEKDEAIAEVQTDKVDMEVEAPASGILRDIRFGPDATVPVTTVIALIAAPGEQIAPGVPHAPTAGPRPEGRPETKTETKATPVAQRVAAAAGVDLARVTPSGSAGRITRADVEKALAAAPALDKPRATPAARRVAREGGVEVGAVPGSGPAGRVQAADVTAFLEAQTAQAAAALEPSATPEAKPTATAAPLRGMRRTIAVRLAQAWQAIPHIFLSTTIDMTQAETLRARLAPDVERAGGRLTPTVLLARVVATALRRHPRLNAWLQGSGGDLTLTEHAAVNLGIAVALGDGLIVPVVAGADHLGLAALAAQVADLSARARAGQLEPQEVMDGTFTISNLGMYPVEHFTAIINPPQVAILAVGRTQMQPVWNGDGFQPRPVVQVTLSADHRAVDGVVAAAFLAEVKALAEEPERLLL